MKILFIVKSIIIFLTFASIANASNNSFVGVIGAAIGDIKNQKN